MMKLLVLLLGVFLTVSCSGEQGKHTVKYYPDHYAPDGRFRNPYLEESEKSLIEFMWARTTTDWADWFGNETRVLPLELDPEILKADYYEKPRITWIGHSTVLIQYKDKTILTDPIFSDRASPVSFAGPKRMFEPALSLSELPKIDYVIISHSHYDHLDADTVEALANDTVWVVPLKMKAWFDGYDVSQVIELDWWQAHTDGDLTLRLTPSQHWSNRTPWDKNEVLWGSWQIKIDDFNSWFGGDTGYNPHQFKEIGSKLGPFDFAMIPIGAYEPRWFMKNMHVNPKDAVEIHRDIKSELSMGVHWNTFQLTAEQIDEPKLDLAEALKKYPDAAEFRAVPIGSSFQISEK
ncbi:MBL fold metallo-hydrolase [Litoribacillus peritrichatus]|uniref:MBL fold metallo-hydrolase n=1 Tax=Litoribacillus peritrichatus TaxID=718191 RepID=A0ABP7MFA9_9GAMM